MDTVIWVQRVLRFFRLVAVIRFVLPYDCRHLDWFQGEEESQAESAQVQAEDCGGGCHHQASPGKEDATLNRFFDCTERNKGYKLIIYQ